MATTETTSTASTGNKKTTAAKAAATKSAAGAKPAAQPQATPAPGEIIAERYRDTSYETLVGSNGENVSAVMSAGEAMLAGMAEVSQEMMTFAGDRLRQDMEVAEDFSKARSPEELFEKQCSFAQRAAQQYAEETSKLFGMFARIQEAAWAPMQERTKQALHDLNGDEEEAEK